MLKALYRNATLGRMMMTPRGMRLDRMLVRRFGRSLVARIWAAQGGFEAPPVLLLTTRGRKSGEPRSAVLPYFRIGGTYYVVGSNGGKARDAFWVDNLRAAPEARIRVDRRDRDVTATILAPGSEERDKVWAEASRLAPSYIDYQGRTSRTIPVVALR